MAYTAQQLITRAFTLSGVVSRGLQTVTGDQISSGLNLLNSLLGWKSVETDVIPYYAYNTTFITVPGQEEYFIPNCLSIEAVTFNLGVLRYSMNNIPHTQYFGSGRVDNIQTLPFNYTFLREKGGGNLYLYFLPDQAYQLKILGKFGLTDVILTTDLEQTYDPSYIEYLRYSLAQYICSEYGIMFNTESEKILKMIERQLMYVTPPDLSMQKNSILTTGNALSWAQINIGRGWSPS